MNAMTLSPVTKPERSGSPGNDLPDYRERRAFEEFERAERRRANLAQQSATVNSAELRIRAWEKAHQLRVPVDPLHPVLDAIAAATRLTLAEVQEEQRRRSAPRIPVAV
jgi:hypothetical protein